MCYMLEDSQGWIAPSIRQRSRPDAGTPESRGSRSAAAPSRSPEPRWPSPLQWPSRPRPFQAPPRSRARRSLCASVSCTRARIRPSRSRPGSPRRRALDQALAELEADPSAKHPSTAWRREFSLLLGLERLLSDDEPKLADGTVLSAHQVDALSGTLTALLAEAQRTANGNGRAAPPASPELLASAEILGPEDAPQRRTAPARLPRRRPTAADDEEDEDSTRRTTRTTRTRTTTRISARSSAPRPTREDDEEEELDDEESARRRDEEDDEPELADRVRGGAARLGRGGRGGGGSPSSPRTPTPPSASGSSTRQAPARRSRRSASWRPRRPAGS